MDRQEEILNILNQYNAENDAASWVEMFSGEYFTKGIFQELSEGQAIFADDVGMPANSWFVYATLRNKSAVMIMKTYEKEEAYELINKLEKVTQQQKETPTADEPKKKLTAEARFNEAFIESVIEAVRNNDAPWSKSWKTGEIQTPYNAKLNTIYSGRNAIRLQLEAQKRGYQDPRWATYHQISAMGGKVNKGEKGVGILWYSEKTVDDQTFPIAKHYHVFNIEQTNLPTITLEERREHTPDLQTFADLVNEHNPIIKSGEPAYRPSNDSIYMPDKESFRSDAEYYSTFLHEMSHWTGHESRLNRNIKNKFGSPEYAQEELVAELSSYMISLETGLPFNPSNSEAYLQHWAEKTGLELEESMMTAFKNATRAKNFINTPLYKERKQEAKKYETQNNRPTRSLGKTFSIKNGNTEYPFNVQILMRNHYAGIGRFCKNQEEIIDYLKHEGFSEKEIKPTILNYLKEKENNSEQAQESDFWQLFSKEIDESEIFNSIHSKKPFYLAVPFDDRVEAKTLGAKWDNEKKSWFVPADADLSIFSKWHATDKVQTSGKNINDFCAEASALGLDMTNFNTTPDQWHRVALHNKNSHNKDGAYKIFHNPDGTIGAVAKNFSTNEEIKWSTRSADKEHILPEVKKANEINRGLYLSSKQEARQQIANSRENDVKILFKKLPNAQGNEPYISRKGIRHLNGIKKLTNGDIVIPLISGERIGGMKDKKVGMTSLQVISHNGEKRLMTQACKAGSYFPIGSKAARLNPSHVFIAEGVATADSVYQLASNKHGENVLVVAAIDSNNLLNIAEKMQLMYPNVEKIIAADNDRGTEQKNQNNKNPGISAAQSVIDKYPDFKLIIPYPINEKNTDWNDVLTKKGLEQGLAEFNAEANKKKSAIKQISPDLAEMNLEGLCPRDVGKKVFEVIDGKIELLPKVTNELAKKGFSIDLKAIRNISNPFELQEALKKSVRIKNTSSKKHSQLGKNL